MQRVTQPRRVRSKRAGASAAHRSVVRSLADGGAEQVVVGLPLSLSGADSAQTREVRAFVDRPRGAVTVPVELYDERFTTKLAAPDGGGRLAAVGVSGRFPTVAVLSTPPLANSQREASHRA
jgi:RNase H-fold protein (predicted Holliday junction resolvase)